MKNEKKIKELISAEIDGETTEEEQKALDLLKGKYKELNEVSRTLGRVKQLMEVSDEKEVGFSLDPEIINRRGDGGFMKTLLKVAAVVIIALSAALVPALLLYEDEEPRGSEMLVREERLVDAMVSNSMASMFSTYESYLYAEEGVPQKEEDLENESDEYSELLDESFALYSSYIDN